MASSSEDLNASGAMSTDDENLEDTQADGKGKKKRFKPMKALKNLFASKKRKQAKDVVSKAKSTSELTGPLDTEQSTSSSPLNGNRCMSADSVFTSDPGRDDMPQKRAVSLEALSPSAGLQADLFAKIKARSSDEGFCSPLGSQNMDELVIGGGIRPGMSTESENSLMSYGSSSDDEFFNTSWKVDFNPSGMAATPDGATDFDLDVVSSTNVLRHDAAQHKRSVRPKTKRQSSFARTRQAPTMSLPSLKEESPAREILETSSGAEKKTAATKSVEAPKDVKPTPLAPPKTKPKPSRLSLEVSEEEAPMLSSPKKTPTDTTPSITMAMLGDVKLRQNKSTKVESERKSGSETEQDSEISKAFGKLRRKSQENGEKNEKVDKPKVEENKNTELSKILQKRKSMEVDQNQQSSAQKDSNVVPKEENTAISSITDKNNLKSSAKIPSKTEVTASKTAEKTKSEKRDSDKAIQESKLPPQKTLQTEPKPESGSVRLRNLKKDDTTKIDGKGDNKSETDAQPLSVSERMSVFGAPTKVRKVKLPDRRSKTVEVEKLPSAMTKSSEGASPRLSYSKSFHDSSSRETSPQPRQAGSVRLQAGSRVSILPQNEGKSQSSWLNRKQEDNDNKSSAERNVSKKANVEARKQTESESSKTDSPADNVPAWRKTDRERTPPTTGGTANKSWTKTVSNMAEQAKNGGEKSAGYSPSWKRNEKETSPVKSTTDEKASATPSWKRKEKEPSPPVTKTEEKTSSGPSWKRTQKETSPPSQASDNKSSGYVPSWKKKDNEKPAPEKSIEIIDNKNTAKTNEPAWKANVRHAQLKREASEEKPILIEEKSPVKVSETKAVKDNKETEAADKKKPVTGSIRLQSGDKSEKTAMARKSKVMDLLKNFQTQEVTNV